MTELVSIICFCKDRKDTIARCIESVMNQTYSNIEFVVQDGASTDGTLEILKEYASNDSRIKLISEKDCGPEEGFYKVLQRCNGSIVGTCLSDEELLPQAVETAVGLFDSMPDVDVLTGNGYFSDTNGNITGEFIAGEFGIVNYLFSKYCPFWPGSFFRLSALIDIGIYKNDWNLSCLEFEIWCRLGTQKNIQYVERFFAKYGIHANQLSNAPSTMYEHISARIKIIDYMFLDVGFFGIDDTSRDLCKLNQLGLFYKHALAYKLSDISSKLEAEILTLINKPSISFYVGDNSFFLRKRKSEARAYDLWQKLAFITPKLLRNFFSSKYKSFLQRNFSETYIIIANFDLVAREYLRSFYARILRKLSLHTDYSSEILASLNYDQIILEKTNMTALLFEARGQVDIAVEIWKKIRNQNDFKHNALACQSALKIPNVSESYISNLTREFMNRYNREELDIKYKSAPTVTKDRKIRIAYACSFFDSSCIRAQMQGVFSQHARSNYSLTAYASGPVGSDLLEPFDGFRNVANINDNDFIDLVRSDNIDILVELSGFSPGNKFREMSKRCAPLQISYLNHTGTSGLSEIDYIISDYTSMPEGQENDFNEKIYRMNTCFFCFDYHHMPMPDISEPPSLRANKVVFGSFASGGKINKDLIKIWSDLLHLTKNSQIFLKNRQLNSIANRNYIISLFAKNGIGADRLRIEGGDDRNNILELYSEIDICLDTWPYCGGNSTGEALWQGVPVVTLCGSRFSSRYGSSLLRAAGCEEYIAYSPEEYVKICAELADNTDRRFFLRNNLRKLTYEYGLSNSQRLSNEFDTAFNSMLHCS